MCPQHLVVSLAGGFAPAVGAEFLILSAASVSGPFATEDFSAAPLGSGLAWGVFYTSTSVTLKVVAGIPGDYNDNGTVDAADYVLWRKGGPLANEVDTPGTVGGADYTEWRARFGSHGGSGAVTVSQSAVPEPANSVLLLTAAVWIFRRRRSA